MNFAIVKYEEEGEFLSYKDPWHYGDVLEIKCNESINNKYFHPFADALDCEIPGKVYKVFKSVVKAKEVS